MNLAIFESNSSRSSENSIASKHPGYPHPQHMVSGEGAGKMQIRLAFQIIKPDIRKECYCIFALIVVHNDSDFGEEFKTDPAR